jgi:CHASE2 domain-containing sensor protein
MIAPPARGVGLGLFVRYLFEPPWYRSPALVLVVIFLLTQAANRRHLFSILEQFAGDLTLAVISVAPPRHVVVVAIDDEMYEREFDGRSPLNPERVAKLIRDVSAGSPRVVVVDIDTAHQDFQKLETDALAPPPPAVAPAIVWFRDVRVVGEADDKQALRLGQLLGDRAQDTKHLFGIGRLQVDTDGMVRRYQRTFEHVEGHGIADSLAWKSVLAYCGSRVEPPCDRVKARLEALTGARNEQERHHLSEALLVFSRSPLAAALASRPLSRLLQEGARPAQIQASALDSGEWWKPYVRDKIVVLGGTFEAGRDTHRTAFGDAQGVTLWAASIENELQGPVHAYEGRAAELADLAIGLAFLYFNWRWVRLRPGTPGNLILNVIFLLVIWLIAWRVVLDYSMLVGIVPMLAGLWVHQLWDLAAESRELRSELEALAPAHGLTSAAGGTHAPAAPATPAPARPPAPPA